MNTEKKLTGYPSVDKPHYKYYRSEPIRKIESEQTIYEMVFNANKSNMKDPAIEYMGKSWTFEQLKADTDKTADAFAKSGLKMGDVVLIGVANCYEVVIILLALNKLGVVSKWFDVRASEKDIQEYANESNCRYIIAFDMLLPKIQPILDNTKLEKVLIIRPTDFLSPFIQAMYSFKANKIPKDSRYIRFKDFIKTGKVNSNVNCVEFDANRPSVMIQSSGTTGKAKVIIHSDFSATSYLKKFTYADVPIGAGKTALVILPPWIAYSLGGAILCALTVGAKAILSPTIEPHSIVKYLGKFNIALTAPVCYRYLKDNLNSLTPKQLNGMKMVECYISGGDKITVEENREFEQLFNSAFINGYGNNECWSGLTLNPVNNNRYGTVGIPKYGDVIISYDNEKNQELPYGQVGEICVLTETMFMHYENNPEATAEVKKKHPDGKIWLHTGDLGYIDEDGFVTLQGRLRRVITRKAFKISAYTIEDKICEHSCVKECVTVEVNDKEEEHVPMAFIVLKNGIDDEESTKNGIIEKCKNELKDYEVPKYFRIVSELPYTQNNKYDFRLLEQQGNDYVNSMNRD